ncbi:hypothetical protein HUG15_19380 [Salicibibacter cibarius]|uniref:Uncharacterized protein n=1 Tax=Salicibibacter cibarius TaxID=2743000 RepID=A0A7T6Z5Z9_9BACI|nr:hypothetical protein [Salicibibacter cibarius]QQK77529.1 hypothetical protein HUG15_19380 [Salicibibacter cibarius]
MATIECASLINRFFFNIIIGGIKDAHLLVYPHVNTLICSFQPIARPADIDGPGFTDVAMNVGITGFGSKFIFCGSVMILILCRRK